MSNIRVFLFLNLKMVIKYLARFTSGGSKPLLHLNLLVPRAKLLLLSVIHGASLLRRRLRTRLDLLSDVRVAVDKCCVGAAQRLDRVILKQKKMKKIQKLKTKLKFLIFFSNF